MGIYYTVHFLILLACLFEGSSENIKKRVMWVLMLMVTCFGGLRWQIGGDWYQYYDHFLNSNYANIFTYKRHGNTLEPFFVFINATIRYIFGTFWAYNLIIVGFIQYTYYRMSWRFSPRYPIMFYSFIMILASNYFPVRAGLSLGVICWAYLFLEQRKYKHVILSIVIAFFIHRQCLAFIPILFAPLISKYIKWKYVMFLYFLFGFVGYVFRDYVVTVAMMANSDDMDFTTRYAFGENEGHASKVNSYIGWGLNAIFLSVYFYVRKKKGLIYDNLYNTLLIGVLAYNGFTMIFTEGGMGTLTRISRIFVYPQVILFIYSMTYFLQQKRKKFYQREVAILFFIAYYLYRMTKIGSGFYFEDTCLPYKTIFDYHLL